MCEGGTVHVQLTLHRIKHCIFMAVKESMYQDRDTMYVVGTQSWSEPARMNDTPMIHNGTVILST